jgi:hypothetical protein
MMNMIELQDKLKNFSQDQLVSMMQQPTGEAPQFMVLSEITRRQKMQKEAESQQAPTQSVAQEAVTAAGVPQGGIADMARSLAPQTNVAQNTGVNPAAPPQGMPMPSAPQGPAPMAAAPQGIARMASGGVIKMQAAGKVQFWPQDRMMKLAGIVNNGKSINPDDFPERKIIATVPYGYRGEFINVYNDYTLMNVNKDGIEYDIVRDKTSANKVFDALDVPVEDRQLRTEDVKGRPELIPLDFFMSPQMKIDAQKKAAESAPTGLGAYAAPTMDAPVSDSAPSTPVFDATVDASIAPQMSVPPKTDSMPQGPRPSTTGGTQVNIAGNIYAVLDDGSVIDQTGRTPPPPVAELARTKAVSMAREPAPSLNQAPAADTAIYGGGYDPRTNVPSAPSGLAALSPDTMPTVDGPFAYPASRFSTNLGPRAMLDWEEGQAEEAALIDARTNADLGSGRTPRYDTAIGPQPTSPQTETPIDLEAYLKSIYPDYGQEDARTNADLGSGRTPRYDTAIGPQPAPPPPAAALLAPSLEEVMDQFGVNRADAQAIIDRTYTPRINGEGSPFAVNENAPTGTRDAYSMIFGPLPAPYFNSELTAAEKRAVYEKEQARREKETAAFAAAETPASVPLEKSALAAGLTGDIKPKARPKDLFAPTTDNALNGATTGATTGATGSGSGGMSDYETELMKIMKSREKAAESDKWLALAQVGMGLMQGGSGSFLGDVGAAGMKGLETLRTSRDQADTDKLSLLKAREDARIDRARIAASAAKGTAPNATALKSVIEDLDMEMAPLAAKEALGKLTPDEKCN